MSDHHHSCGDMKWNASFLRGRLPKYQCWSRYQLIQNEVPKQFLWVPVWISGELWLYKCNFGVLKYPSCGMEDHWRQLPNARVFCLGMGLGRAGSFKTALLSWIQVQGRHVFSWSYHQVILLQSSLASWGSSWFDMKHVEKLQAEKVLTVWDGKSLIIPAVGKVSALCASTVFGLSAS